jgi:hypothetical protein
MHLMFPYRYRSFLSLVHRKATEWPDYVQIVKADIRDLRLGDIACGVSRHFRLARKKRFLLTDAPAIQIPHMYSLHPYGC